MQRRDFLNFAPALALGSVGVSLLPAAGHAHEHGHGPKLFTAMQRFSLGDWTIVALSDGFLPFDYGLFSGVTPKEAQELMRQSFYDPANFIGAVNAFLIDTGETLIMVDVGTGAAFGPTLGHTVSNLKAAGYEPADVSLILATHLHPDHVGGVLTDAGNPFPNSTLAVNAADHAFFTSAEIRAGAPDDFKPFFDMAVGAVGSFGERLSLFEGTASVAPGITAMPLFGHTPGHSGFMLESAGQTMLMAGDILHAPGIQFARPDVSIAFDADPTQAAATRGMALDMLSADRLLFAGSHVSFPGFGYLEKAGEGYRFTPAPWQYL
ncbi:MAG: MBL fold metallo-hydrolase [Pseudomonadota bacterium]